MPAAPPIVSRSLNVRNRADIVPRWAASAAPGRPWIPRARRLAPLLAIAFLGAEPARAAAPPPYIVDHSQSPQAALRPLPYDAVSWTRGFWAERFQQLVAVTLGESWRLMALPEKGHVIDNFRAAARSGSGEFAGTEWQDEWLYKWIEAAACVWRTTRDPALLQRLDEAVALIGGAQEPDGYLSTNITARGRPRFARARNHELYNMGHLLTAAVIHHRLTGKDNLLKIATRTADFICANVGTSIKPYLAHNPSAIMGLMEFHRLTGERKYRDCAQLIVDRRGQEPRKKSPDEPPPSDADQGTDIIQDRVPLRQATEVVGHNVFFTYLYTGAGDLINEGADAPLAAALERLWADLTERRMYLHGGVSAIPRGLSINDDYVVEAAGAPHELPNGSCYNETCGQIGVFMWGYRMLTHRPEARFADVMEREMYNGFLPCIGLEGRSWFYRAVLRRYDENYQAAAGWTDMTLRQTPGPRQICCPSNLLRTMAQLSAYFYSLDADGVWVHHYGGTKVSCVLPSGEPIAFEQSTNYPWDGTIRLALTKAPASAVNFRLRIPDWAATARLSLNGNELPLSRPHGYTSIKRRWNPGDTLTLELAMPAQLLTADPRVEATRNQVAVVRGPVVYCVESPDLPVGIDLPSVLLPSNAVFTPATGLAGVDSPLAPSTIVLRGPGLHRPDPRNTTLYRPVRPDEFRPIDVQLIPYFAWANRGRSTMSIWMPVIWR